MKHVTLKMNLVPQNSYQNQINFFKLLENIIFRLNK